MPNCRDITEQATRYAEGALEPAARQGFESHLATCPDCRTWVGQLGLTAKLAGTLRPPELTPGTRAALLAQFDAWATRGAGEAAAPARGAAGRAGGLRWEAFFVLSAVVAALVGLGRHPSHAWADRLTALALAAVAIGLAAAARRLTLRFATAAVSAALVAAAIRGEAGPLDVPEGVQCLLAEAAGALAVVGLMWLASRRRRAATSVGPWAAAGALAGDAALQITCAAHASLAHAVVFHVGGVLAVVAVALAATRAWRTA
jgi:hypothetical protein